MEAIWWLFVVYLICIFIKALKFSVTMWQSPNSAIAVSPCILLTTSLLPTGIARLQRKSSICFFFQIYQIFKFFSAQSNNNASFFSAAKWLTEVSKVRTSIYTIKKFVIWQKFCEYFYRNLSGKFTNWESLICKCEFTKYLCQFTNITLIFAKYLCRWMVNLQFYNKFTWRTFV